MSALDYPESHSQVQTNDSTRQILANDIFEIADINNQDIIIYDLKGKFLISNKDINLISQKEIPIEVINRVLKSDTRVDFQTYDKKIVLMFLLLI